MPPKKSNGFMTFVQEWRSNNSQGRNMTIPQAVSHCGEIWKNMNAQERGPYNSKAKNADVLSRVKTERMNSCGQAISAVEQEERKGAEQQMQMKLGIERMVLDGKKQYDLENTKFVFAAFNYFAKTNSNGIYIPAEFAACLFSLKSGKTSIYSSLINPGHIIFGQSSESQHHAQTTHQLPLPPNALGESDMGRLYSNILEYLRSCQIDENPHGPLVVFTSSDLMPVVKGCFRYLSCDMESKAEQIYVYDIQYLFFVLKKEVMELADLSHNNINKSITDALFLNDHFEYHSGLSCQFHEDHDRSKYCVQSLVTRWSYIFSDYMCGDLAIKPLLGKHMPPKQECKFKVVNPKLDESSANNSFASCSSFQSEVKTENHRKFVPTDHTAFSASINNTAEFPSLGGRKSRVVRQPLSTNFPGRAPKNDWNVPASNLSAKDIEDAFNMNALV